MAHEMITTKEKNSVIIKASKINIICNASLAVFEMMLALGTGSSILFSAAMSTIEKCIVAVVSIIGITYSMRKPDRTHPHGYTRARYLAEIVSAEIIILAAFGMIAETLELIEHTSENMGMQEEYSTFTFIILFASFAINLYLGIHEYTEGKHLGIRMLKAASHETFGGAAVDGFALLVTIIEADNIAMVQLFFGVAVTLYMLYGSVKLLFFAARDVIGQTLDEKTVSEFVNRILSIDGCNFVYDIRIVRIGEEELMGSASVEVDEDLSIRDIYIVKRKISEMAKEEFNIDFKVFISTSIEKTEEEFEIHDFIIDLARKIDGFAHLYGFYPDLEHNRVYFHVEMTYDTDESAISDELTKSLGEHFPDLKFHITYSYIMR